MGFRQSGKGKDFIDIGPGSPFKRWIGLTPVLIVILLVFTFVGCGFSIVDTGHRGVETRFGKVVGESLPEGLYFYNPLTSNIIKMTVRESKWEETTTAYTKDVQNVKVFFTFNYHPDPTQMHILYEKVGFDWSVKIIPQVVLGRIKEVVGQYEAVKLVSDRQAATKAISDQIAEDLKNKSVILRNFEVTNLDFNDPFENAVEAKVVAIQTAEEAKNRTVKVREEADQKIIAAKAEAESMRIRSQALSQNKGLVDYEAVQKWNGVLPEIVMGNSIPFVNINKK